VGGLRGGAAPHPHRIHRPHQGEPLMLVTITDRKTNDFDIFEVRNIEDVSRGSRSIVKLTLKNGAADEIDLHVTKLDILPNVS
jgi:hypothetical protein